MDIRNSCMCYKALTKIGNKVQGLARRLVSARLAGQHILVKLKRGRRCLRLKAGKGLRRLGAGIASDRHSARTAERAWGMGNPCHYIIKRDHPNRALSSCSPPTTVERHNDNNPFLEQRHVSEAEEHRYPVGVDSRSALH